MALGPHVPTTAHRATASQRASRAVLTLAAGFSALHLAWRALTPCFALGRAQVSDAWGPNAQVAARLGQGHPVRLKAQGFVEKKKRQAEFKRKRYPDKQLEEHHGKNKWEAVSKVLKGEPATCPEDLMRARYSAMQVKDVVFLAKSEIDPNRNATREKVEKWACSLGLKGTPDDPELSSAHKEMKALNVISSDNRHVEFKIDCGESGVHWEKSLFNQHPEMGYIYAESDFCKLLSVDTAGKS